MLGGSSSLPEMRGPDRVGQDRHVVRRAHRCLLVGEEPAQRRPGAEGVEGAVEAVFGLGGRGSHLGVYAWQCAGMTPRCQGIDRFRRAPLVAEGEVGGGPRLRSSGANLSVETVWGREPVKEAGMLVQSIGLSHADSGRKACFVIRVLLGAGSRSPEACSS
jgi:hypothetical protein